jgi:hypothetical protein
MNVNGNLSGLARLARITASSLEVAIAECESGRPEFCLRTLESLHALCAEIADSNETVRDPFPAVGHDTPPR